MKVWHLPEKLLKSRSTFFTAALEGGFAEGKSKNITLPEENPDIFKCFVEWLYVGSDEPERLDSNHVVILWTLGDRLGCPLMQDDAICLLASHYRYQHIGASTLKLMYEASATGSKLRRFAVDQCLFHVSKSGPAQRQDGSSYLRFMKDNEDFAHQLAEETILRGSEKPRNPSRDKSPYLCAPSTAQSK